MDTSKIDKSLPEGESARKTNGKDSQTQKKKKGKDISAEFTVNFKYENFEPVYNKLHTGFKRNQSKEYYNNLDILDQNRFKFILNVNEPGISPKPFRKKDFQINSSKRPAHYSKYSYGINSTLNWEDIWFVIYYSVDVYTCPICLEKKLTCPVITRCGHIFCWPCLFNYNDYWTNTSLNKKLPECPLCKEHMSIDETKFCEVLHCVNYVDLKLDEKFEKVPEGKIHTPFNTNHINFNLIMKNKKAPTLYNTFYDPDLEYYKQHLHQKDAFNFIPLESQVEFSFSRIFMTSPSLVLKRYALLKTALEETLKDELNYLTDERMVNSLNTCIEILNEESEKMKILKEKKDEREDEEGYDSESINDNNNISSEQSIKMSPIILTKKIENENMAELNSLKDQILPMGASSTPLSSSDGVSYLPNSENLNNYSTFDDDIMKNEKNDLNLKDFLYFFQEHYGDIYYLHPINYSILLAEYGDEQHLPTEISGRILEIEMHQITPYLKNKHPFLNHLKIGSLVYFVEIDMKNNVSNHTLKNFHNLLKERAKVRYSIKREEDHYDNWVQNIKLKEEKKISIELLEQKPKFIKSEVFKDDPSLVDDLILSDRKLSFNSEKSENEIKKESKLKSLFNEESSKKVEVTKTVKKFQFNAQDFPNLEENGNTKSNLEDNSNPPDLIDSGGNIDIEQNYGQKINNLTNNTNFVKKKGKNKKNNKNCEELDIFTIQEENKKKEELLKAKKAELTALKQEKKENKIFTTTKK